MPIRSLTYSPSRTLLTVVRDYSTGAERVWRTDNPVGTSSFEAYNASNASKYGITTSPASPCEYEWTIPGLPALSAPDQYRWVTYDVTGTTLAVAFASTAGPLAVWEDTFGWDGTNFVSVQSAAAAAIGAIAGTGALPVTVTVTDGTNPVQGATVRAMINGQTAGVGTTNASAGAVSLALNAGVYALATAATGFNGSVGSINVSSGSQAFTVTLTAINVPAPVNPSSVIGTVTKTDGSGRPLAGAIFTFQLVANPNGDDISGSTERWQTDPTDANGHTFAEFVTGWGYRGWAGVVIASTTFASSGAGVPFTAPSSNWNVPTILGI